MTITGHPTIQNRRKAPRKSLRARRTNEADYLNHPVPKSEIEAFTRQQLFMCAFLGNAVLIQHNDPVGISDRRQTVRDRNSGTPFGEILETSCHKDLAFVIQSGGCLIQDKDPRIFQEYAGDRKSLLLAS